MNDPNKSLTDALDLELLKLSDWCSKAADERRAQIGASERSLAARGLAKSGARFKAEADIIFTTLESTVDNAIALRQELGAKVPALLEAGNLESLRQKLEKLIDGGVNGVRARMTHFAPKAAAGSALIRQAEQKASAAKMRLHRKLAALPLEARLGAKQTPGAPVTTVNISNSTIATLNLGSVLGDLNSSIQQLTMEGQKDLAGLFAAMTEAVRSSSDLDDAARKELLENLAAVSEESAKPSEKRRIGPLKASFCAMKSGIGVATQLLNLWQGIEQALKSAGIIPG